MWIISSFAALTCFATFIVLLRYLTGQGIGGNVVISTALLFAAVPALGQFLMARATVVSLNMATLAIMAFMGLIFWAGNWLQSLAIANAPQAGLAVIIINCSTVAVMLAGVIMGDTLTARQVLGCVVCLAGLATIVL